MKKRKKKHNLLKIRENNTKILLLRKLFMGTKVKAKQQHSCTRVSIAAKLPSDTVTHRSQLTFSVIHNGYPPQ